MKGFFAGSEVISKQPLPLLPRCGACGLYTKCDSPKMKVGGEGKRKILILGEAPGDNEDEQGTQFVGTTGQYLQRKLRAFGIDMRQDCWLHNALACHPRKNAKPTSEQIDSCRPLLVKALKELQPEIVIPLGGAAVSSLLGMLWKQDAGGISKWVGFQIPSQPYNCWICPTFHPSFVMREMRDKKDRSTAELFFEKHLEAAVEKSGRPWVRIPDYKQQVEVIEDTDRAAAMLRKMIAREAPIAFDYETNMLKPDSPQREIISCAVCWKGQKTIAYPWAGKAIEATRELLRAPHPKIASNLKFEQRWTRQVLKTKVRNWIWDTMLAAHVMSNRSGITSVKFQAFVLLGQPPYNEHIEQFMQSKEGSVTNQLLDQVELRDLLIYNGMDALLEYKVAQKQMEILNATSLARSLSASA